MKSMKSELANYRRLVKLINLFQQINQISWTVDQTRKRYPVLESMTNDEIEQLSKVFLALGFDIETWVKEWKKLYKEYETKNAITTK